jgi:hypothetical protein
MIYREKLAERIRKCAKEGKSTFGLVIGKYGLIEILMDLYKIDEESADLFKIDEEYVKCMFTLKITNKGGDSRPIHEWSLQIPVKKVSSLRPRDSRVDWIVRRLHREIGLALKGWQMAYYVTATSYYEREKNM